MDETRKARAARLLALGMMLAGLATGPAAAGHAFPIGPIYTSPKAIEEAQAILEGTDLLKPGAYKKGDLDQATIDALRQFQRKHFLRPSGQLDPDTMALLSSHAGAGAPRAASAAVRPATMAAPTGASSAGERVAATRTMPETGSPFVLRVATGALLILGGALLLLRRGV